MFRLAPTVHTSPPTGAVSAREPLIVKLPSEVSGSEASPASVLPPPGRGLGPFRARPSLGQGGRRGGGGDEVGIGRAAVRGVLELHVADRAGLGPGDRLNASDRP